MHDEVIIFTATRRQQNEHNVKGASWEEKLKTVSMLSSFAATCGCPCTDAPPQNTMMKCFSPADPEGQNRIGKLPS